MLERQNRYAVKTCNVRFPEIQFSQSFRRKTNVRVPGWRGIDECETFPTQEPRDTIFPQTEASLRTGLQDEKMAKRAAKSSCKLVIRLPAAEISEVEVLRTAPSQVIT